MIDLTIVIPSYEAQDCLTECLAAIRDAERAHPELALEVIVVDNGSRDESLARARESVLAPRLIAWVRNRGFAAAVNAGLRIRRGRHALLLNSDVRVAPDLLVGAVAVLDDETEIGVLGPALFHSDGRPQRSVHASPGLLTEFVPDFLLRRFRPAGFARGGPADETTARPRDVEAVRGAVFFIRGELLEKIGLFDEGYFFFLEETDYCARVRASGARVAYLERLRAQHRLGASSKHRAPLATRIEFHRSLYRFVARWRGPGSVRVVRFGRLFRNLISVLLLSVPAIFFTRARVRAAERIGLLLWHLRGCPAEPTLAHELQRARMVTADSAEGHP
ncbi:MAG: hypothetical protein CL933_19965 [Deltaproteobacteria bacterium]|nr:hypothetical protein [Deltaproteobacteria bacterium]